MKVERMAMMNNTSVQQNETHVETTWQIVVATSAMCSLVFITVVGNIFVTVSVFTYRPLRTVQNFYIVSLALADLMVAVFVMPFHISNALAGEWLFNTVFCDLWLTFDVLLCTASILNICAIALDRYWAIHSPLSYAQKRTLKRVLFIIGSTWVLSAIVSVPPLFGWRTESTVVGLYNCHLTSEKGYVIYSACGSFYIPLCIMTFVYLKIYLATKKRLREKAKAAAATKMAIMKKSNKFYTSIVDENEETKEEFSNINGKENHTEITTTTQNGSLVSPQLSRLKSRGKSREKKTKSEGSPSRVETFDNPIHKFFEEKQRISLSRERKATRTLAIIMIAFVLCWLPFFLMYVILPFCQGCMHPGPGVETLFVWLGYVNSGLNPIIYTIFNTEFRKAFNEIIHGRCCGKQRHRNMSRPIRL